MKKFIGILILCLCFTGCSNKDEARIKELEEQVARLEQQQTVNEKEVAEERNGKVYFEGRWVCPNCLHEGCPVGNCNNYKQCVTCNSSFETSTMSIIEAPNEYVCEGCIDYAEYVGSCEYCSRYGTYDGSHGPKLLEWWDNTEQYHSSCEGECTTQLKDLYLNKICAGCGEVKSMCNCGIINDLGDPCPNCGGWLNVDDYCSDCGYSK